MASTSSSMSTTVTATKTPSPSCPHTSGYSKGATAGIGIGSGLAGALLALLVGFLLLKTRRSVPDLLRLDSTVPPRRERGGGGRAGAGAGADSLPAVLTRLEDHLPQAITHAELASAAASLEAAIGNYLDNYIDWGGSPPASLLDNDRLRELAGGSGADWKQKLLDRDTRYAALRMFIARFLVARTDAKGTPGSTILPSEILQTYQAVVDGQTFGKREIPVMRDTWRAMTAFLVSSIYPLHKEPLRSSHRLYEAVDREARSLRDTLAPLRSKRKGTETREHEVLLELVAKASLLGLRMFAQRKPTEFFWLKKNETFPGLRQRLLQPGTVDGRPWQSIREPQM